MAASLPLAFAIPVFLTLVFGFIGYYFTRNPVCRTPNTILWVMTALFILGPGLVAMILSLRLKNSRAEYLEHVDNALVSVLESK